MKARTTKRGREREIKARRSGYVDGVNAAHKEVRGLIAQGKLRKLPDNLILSEVWGAVGGDRV